MSTAPPSTPRTVIRVDGLRKAYGSTVAVADVSLEVFEGEIFGLIGPNGAGKTTTMECVEGIRKPDAGSVTVLSLDPRRNSVELQNRIGIQLQQAQLQKRIKVWEAVDLWSFLYPRAVDPDALLDRLGLAEKKDARFMNLSGGQQQRLFIALALINDPELVFLDELTTGLDPQARHAIWALVRDIKQRGKTVFLTTHLMEEAEKLCDRVAIIEHGRVIAVGSPEELVRRHCPQCTVVFTTEHVERAALFENVPGADTVEVNGATVSVRGQGEGFVSAVIHGIAESGIRVADFRTLLPSLEDVFLKLTGQQVRD